MTAWSKLFLDTRIKAKDKFYMVKYTYTVDQDVYKDLLIQLKYSKKIDASNYYNGDLIASYFVNFLKDFCSDGFCIGNYVPSPKADEDDYKQKIIFLIGFRSIKDLFKFNMKFGAKRTRWWRARQKFTVIAKIDDTFKKQKAGDNWNYEDPQAMVEE